MKKIFDKLNKFKHPTEYPRVNKTRVRIQKKDGVGDIWLVLLVFGFTFFGLLMVYNSSVAIAIRDFSDQYYFVREQLRWFVLGIVSFLVLSRLNYRYYQKIALPVLIAVIIMLGLVFVPGLGVHALGASRWIKIGSMVLQPSELAKLGMILYLSAWLSLPEKGRFAAFLLLLGMVVVPVMLEPDLGTSVIIVAISIIVYFSSGAPMRHFLLLIPLITATEIIMSIISPYRMRRLTSFVNPQSDPLGSSYQIRQALIAVGSGGWGGLGLGKSRQKYEYLPEANTDSIFAIIAEEVGFIGSVIFVISFLALLYRIYRIAWFTEDIFGKLVASGIGSWIGIQFVLNIFAIIGLMPLTGIPLPLISYGGSSLVILLSSLGIVFNISRSLKKI